jgi:hypothetical protein
MRACTAVATEVSWNDSDDPEAKYRTEVEFISPEDWIGELRYLFEDFTDGEVSDYQPNKETPAGIAWAKVLAVYPHYKPQDLTGTCAEDLALHSSICELLDTTVKIKATSALDLSRQLQNYIGNKRSTSTKNQPQQDGSATAPAQLWPLIKIVRVYIKNDLVKTGIVLVDLPGCGDSNTARAAVAKNYEKQANAIFVVTRITRAVDDKIASEILNDSFKLQLQLDGTYSSVTLICTGKDELIVDDMGNVGLAG